MIIRVGVGSVDSTRVKRYVDDTTSVCGKGSGSASGVESNDSVSNLSITLGGSRYYLPKCRDNSCRTFVDQLFDSLVAGVSF